MSFRWPGKSHSYEVMPLILSDHRQVPAWLSALFSPESGFGCECTYLITTTQALP